MAQERHTHCPGARFFVVYCSSVLSGSDVTAMVNKKCGEGLVEGKERKEMEKSKKRRGLNGRRFFFIF